MSTQLVWPPGTVQGRPAKSCTTRTAFHRLRAPWPLSESTWESSSQRELMTAAIASRLAAAPGEPAMCTRYRFLAGREPVMLSTSWEPLEVTGGTPVMLPEEGPHAGKGVIARMAAIGQHIIRAEETVTARPVFASEGSRLGVAPGAAVLAVARTYATADRPVETADIVIPAERWALVYQIPVGGEPDRHA